MSDLCEYAIVAYFRIFCRIFHDYMVRIFSLKMPHKTDMPNWSLNDNNDFLK